MYSSKKGQPPSLSSKPQARPAPLAIKDRRSGTGVKKQPICFSHDPARHGVCPKGTSCENEHVDTLTAQGAELYNKVKSAFDRKNAGKSATGKGRGKG